MDERQSEQVGRIVVQCFTTSQSVLTFSRETVLAEFRRAGRTGSGMEMVAVVGAMARDSDLLLSRLVGQIAPVSHTLQAFEEIEAAMRRWLRVCDDEVKHVAQTRQSGRLQDGSNALGIGRDELRKMTEAIERRLEIEKFDFDEISSRTKRADARLEVRKGGRPPAEFWDDMWAAIAASLYNGGLQPKSQADVERAMTDWIEAEGHSAAVSTVRARARRLWDRLDVVE